MLFVYGHGVLFCLFLEFVSLLYNIVYIKVALFAVVFQWNKIIPLVTTRRRDQQNFFSANRIIIAPNGIIYFVDVTHIYKRVVYEKMHEMFHFSRNEQILSVVTCEG
jgi:hypothetical protein